MKAVILAGGKGTRISEESFLRPKPLIEIHGKTMIQWVLDGLGLKGNYIFIIRKEHQKKYNIKHLECIIHNRSLGKTK